MHETTEIICLRHFVLDGMKGLLTVLLLLFTLTATGQKNLQLTSGSNYKCPDAGLRSFGGNAVFLSYRHEAFLNNTYHLSKEKNLPHSHPDQGVWCNSLHFSDIDMWVRSNGFVLKTSGLTNGAQGRFIISDILLQAVGQPNQGSHKPYAFYAENDGYNCMLDRINAWDESRVAYVERGCITLGQYMSDDPEPLTVGATGVIKTPQWAVYNNN